MDYNIPNITAEKVIEATRGVYESEKGKMTSEEVARYIRKDFKRESERKSVSSETARKALLVATQFGFIRRDEQFYMPLDCRDLLIAKRSEQPLFFRKYLNQFRPFIRFLKYIWKEYTISEAIGKTKIDFSLTNNEKDIRASFLNWGVYAQIFDYDLKKDSIMLREKFEGLTIEYLKNLVESLKQETTTRVYIDDKLTNDVNNYLEDEEITLFVKALRIHENDPPTAIDNAGKAFEDFLRRIANGRGLTTTSCNGIGELADLLHNKNNRLIHTKQYYLCMGINSARQAAAHSIDKKTMERWEINKDFALEIILLMLSVIRSIYLFVMKSNEQKL